LEKYGLGKKRKQGRKFEHLFSWERRKSLSVSSKKREGSKWKGQVAKKPVPGLCKRSIFSFRRGGSTCSGERRESPSQGKKKAALALKERLYVWWL